MSGVIQRRIAFVGHYGLLTGLLGTPPNQFNVENGVTTLYGPTKDVDNAAKFLNVMYRGFPEGSDEHLAAVERLEASRAEERRALEAEFQAGRAQVLADLEQGASNGSGALSTGTAEPDGQGDVQSAGGPEGDGSASGSADLGAGAAPAPAGTADATGAAGDGSEHVVKDVSEDAPAASGEGTAQTPEVPVDDGGKALLADVRAQVVKMQQEEAAKSAGPALVNGEPAPAEPNDKLKRALAKLDPKNDDHWTQDGKPSVSAVEKLYGSADVRRKDIEAVAPELNRANAPALEEPKA